MEDFLKEFKSFVLMEKTLIITYKQEYLKSKLKYLDELDKDDKLRSILTNIKIIIYEFNEATSLEWLKYFPNITELECGFNDLDSSSLESLKYVPNLEILNIYCNKIDDLTNLKFVPNLYKLECFNNKIITFLDTSINFINLHSIRCTMNNLKFIDTSNCPSLIFLDCSYNDITELILYNALNLQNLTCIKNQLTRLDLINCKLLQFLNCMHNQLIELNLYGLLYLREIYCSSNNNLNNLNIKDCRRLMLLICEDTQITRLNLTECGALMILNCNSNKLTELNLQGLPNLIEVCCDNNKLSILKINGCKELVMLNCRLNNLTKLDLSECFKLKRLRCSHNNISNILEIRKYLKLDQLECDKVLSYSSYQGIEKCYICIDTSELIDKIITNCGHIFHKDCLTIWINKCSPAAICPYCQQVVYFFNQPRHF